MNQKEIEQEFGRNFLDLMTPDAPNENGRRLSLTGINLPNPYSDPSEWIKNSTLCNLEILKLLSETIEMLEVEARAVVRPEHPLNALLATLGNVALQSAKSGKIFLDSKDIKLPTPNELKRDNYKMLIDNPTTPEPIRDLLLSELGKVNNIPEPVEDNILDATEIRIPEGSPIH